MITIHKWGRISRLLVPLAAAGALAAGLSYCATHQYPITSPHFQIPPGSRIILNEALTIPPNTARVYMQYGKVIAPSEKDRYQANCWFLSWKLINTPQTIQPDTFVVTETQKNEDYVENSSDLKLASASVSAEVGVGIGIGAGTGGSKMQGPISDAPMAIEYTTQFHIHSDLQPDIRLFECSHWDDPSTGEHLTVDKMQSALGKIATIQIEKVPQ